MYKFKNSLIAFAGLIWMSALGSSADAQTFEWSAPINLGSVVNSASADQHPAISSDGLNLYISSDRPGGCGGLDIWVSRRASLYSPWESPVNLGCTINSSANDLAPNLTADGHMLFFHSFRATDNCGGGDIYYAHRDSTSDNL